MMFDNNHKRKGLIGTIVVHALLMVVFIFFGMKYQDPAPEPGIAIVFGFDDTGSGDFKPVPKKTPQPTAPVEELEEVIPETVEEVEPEVAEETEEVAMTQDTEDSPVVAEEKKKQKEKEIAEKKKRDKELAEKKRLEDERLAQEKIERERIEKERAEKAKIKAAQDAKKKNLDSMFSNLKGSDDATGTDANQGDDGGQGYKGSEDGSKDAKNFNGNGGVGNYGNYRLGNRKPKSRPSPIYDGTDQGIVVVRILVDKNGKVVFAEAGAKGSTTTDLQLLKRAREAALKTPWQSDSTAPEKQEGEIWYNFIIEN